jgi:hypothetical protein
MDRKNYSKAGMMTKCTLNPDWKEQIFCTCSEKATGQNRCMYYLPSMDGACDSMEAQKGENRVSSTKADMGLMEKYKYNMPERIPDPPIRRNFRVGGTKQNQPPNPCGEITLPDYYGKFIKEEDN